MTDLPAVVAGGDFVASLTALRDVLAQRLADAGARDVAPIARQLADVLRDLEALRVPEESDDVDELAQRRAERRAEAAAHEPPAVQL